MKRYFFKSGKNTIGWGIDVMKKFFDSNEPYIIAETAYTFEGNKNYLMMQTQSLSHKINAIKYHMLFNIDEYMVKEHSIYNQVKAWILSKKDWKEILIEAKNKSLDTVILVDDTESVEFCHENNELIDAIEIHAACVNDLILLDKTIEYAKKYKKVFIIGISGFEIQELQDIAEYLKNKELKDVLMMYGFQNYPTKPDDINLCKMSILKDLLKYKIGYADHTSFSDVNKEYLIYTAFALGANIQEIHFVLEEGIERTDYSTAISSSRLDNIKDTLEICYRGIGNPDFRLNQAEKKYLNSRKVPVYAKDIKQGQNLDKDSISFKRVETPSRQNKFKENEYYYGRRIKNNVIKDKEISISDFEGVQENDNR